MDPAPETIVLHADLVTLWTVTLADLARWGIEEGDCANVILTGGPAGVAVFVNGALVEQRRC